MLYIEDVRSFCTDETIVLIEHLLTRMRQRNIRLEDIKNAITKGEINNPAMNGGVLNHSARIIEQYPANYPFPGCLINAENIHIVCSVGEGRLYIITAYRPSPEQWESGGRKRKDDRS
jgi:hypothetical protein